MAASTLNPIRLACCLPATPDWLTQQNRFVSSRLSGQTPAAGNMTERWCNGQNSLIGLVRDMPPIWDQTDKKCHNRDLKPQLWNEIGQKVNVTDKY